jgi:hypothetical protein
MYIAFAVRLVCALKVGDRVNEVSSCVSGDAANE